VVSARDAARAAGGLLLALGATASLGACELILKAEAGDRHVDPTIDCSSGTCVCRAGLGDCDGNVDNGCETALGEAPNCGACGAVCTHGACVDSACSCDTGFADCDADRSNGCEAALAGDPKNCGGCRHDCGTGACVEGVCQASTLGTFPGISSLAVDFGFVYVGTCNQPGPAIVSFATGQSTPSPAVAESGCARAITGAGTVLAWASGTAILLSPPTGASKASVLASMTNASRLLGAGPSSLYWFDAPADPTQHALLRAALAGGQVETLAHAELTALTADSTQAYWSDEDGLHAIPHGGTSPVILDASIHASALAVDATAVYAADGPSLWALPLTGGVPALLAPVQQVAAVAADGSYVYWADVGDGEVLEIPAGGGTARVLAVGQAFAPGLPILADGSFVYWVSGNEVRFVAR
jgi:hypothetical protein